MSKVGEIYPKLPTEDMAKHLKNREEEFPTIIAPGVVVPHIHSDKVSRPMCFLVVMPVGFMR